MWLACAAMRSHRGMSAGRAGTAWVQRHNSRSTSSTRKS